MKLFRFYSILLGAIVIAPIMTTGVSAQTQQSYRILSMGVDLEGIVDDFLTDAYLNPASTGGLERPQAYLLTVPSRYVSVPYPYVGNVSYFGVPLEIYFTTYSVTPLAGAFFGNVGTLAYSLSGEVGLSANEPIDTRQDVFVGSSNSVTRRTYEYVYSNDRHYYRFNGAVATTGETRIGVRFDARYTAEKSQEANATTEEIRALTDPTQLEKTVQAAYRVRDFEHVAVGLSVGLERPGRLVEDIVVGGSVGQERLDAGAGDFWFDDEDADGDGHDIFGGRDDYASHEVEYASERDYGGYGVFGRLHLSLGDKVRTTHSASWVRLDGDGSGLINSEEVQFPIPEQNEQLGMRFTRDGVHEAWTLTTAIGYRESVSEDILLGIALRANYGQTRFDENGPGEGILAYGGADNPQQGAFPFGTTETLDHDRMELRLKLPLGVEWAVHKYFKFRMGVNLMAYRVESTQIATRDVSDVSVQATDPIDATLDREIQVSSSTTYAVTNGLEFNLNERLVIDLMTSGSSVDLARYGYVSMQLRF